MESIGNQLGGGTHQLPAATTLVNKIIIMWRLRIAEGGNDPYLYSTNDYVGRQTWVFDPNAGTPEERAEVEAARRQFWDNRYLVKPSGDVLWRMQVNYSIYHDT